MNANVATATPSLHYIAVALHDVVLYQRLPGVAISPLLRVAVRTHLLPSIFNELHDDMDVLQVRFPYVSHSFLHLSAKIAHLIVCGNIIMAECNPCLTHFALCHR